ncbi:MAG: YcaO-like family protein [Deltaproteobacteria bacterium]|nr:YcaO-like family protein [Deltaproteobacteria bacterium]
MRESIAEIFAIAKSSRFTAYEQGVLVHLPTGENVTVKIERTTKSLRPVGLRFSTFAFVTEVSAGAARGFGYGEAPTQLIALQKSIAEGVERAIYKALKGTPHGTPNSNGWAAHINRERAVESAVDELAERDAVLVHWLRKIPMKEITPATWPIRIVRWTQTELFLSPKFNQLRVADAEFSRELTEFVTD